MTSRDFTDEELLPALKNHDDAAIRYLYITHWPMIRNFVVTNSGNEDDAKDLYQEGILDFLEKLWSRELELTCKIKTFVYSICRYKWLYALRGRKTFVDIEEFVVLEHTVHQENEQENKLPEKEEVLNAIASLGEPCKSLLIGFYYEGLSMEQLAVKLNYKSANVVKQQKFRCKDRLKQFFTIQSTQSA